MRSRTPRGGETRPVNRSSGQTSADASDNPDEVGVIDRDGVRIDNDPVELAARLIAPLLEERKDG